MDWACSACAGSNPTGTRFCGHCGAPTPVGDGSRSPALSHPPAAADTPAPSDPPAAADSADSAPPADATDTDGALRSFVSAQVADKLLQSGGDILEERRLVTALFADLSGFTPLADRLDPEELLEVIDPVIAALTEIVGRHEGYVDKFAGDALLAFFGAPVAHEDDASRALRVALEMHERLAEMIPELPRDAEGLTLHIGVNTGHVVARVLGTDIRMDYSVLGDAVILAQRLESAAPAGETYAGPTTHLLTQRAFEFEAVGELTLKGKAAPVPAWRLLGEKTDAPRGSSLVVGRERESRELTDALERSQAGSGSAVTIIGDAGMGKTTLLENLRGAASLRGHRWLGTRCLSYGAGLAYWPFGELFRNLAGIHPHDPSEVSLDALRASLEESDVAEAHPFIARLLGLPSPEVEHHGPEDFRRELHLAVVAGLKRSAASTPLVLVLEDLHWADSASLELARDLARATSDSRILFLATARLEATGLLDDPLVEPESEAQLVLAALTEEATGALIENELGGTAPADLPSFVHDRAAGNPFFALELVRSLKDQGTLVVQDGLWKIDGALESTPIPPTLEGLLSARVDRLRPAEATTLQIASVVGRRVRLPLLRGVHPEQDQVDAHVGSLLSAGFFDPADAGSDNPDEDVVFHHALLQEVAYSRLLRKRRREVHRRLADVAERLYGATDDTIELLARHLYLGGGGEKAVEYLLRAGRRAASLYANAEAILHLQRAAELAQKGEGADLLPVISTELGDLQSLSGRYEEALQSYEVAIERGSRAEAWRGKAAALRNQARFDDALAVLEEAFAEVDDGLGGLWLERTWTLSRRGDFEQAIAAAEAGLQVVASGEEKAHLLGQLARARAATGNAEEGVPSALEAVRLFESLDKPLGLVTALRLSGGVLGEAGRHAEALAALKRGLEVARATGNLEEVAGCLINLGMEELENDALESAIAYDLEAIAEFERVGHTSGLAIGYGNVAEKYMFAGDDSAAIAAAEKAITIARGIDHRPTIADAKRTLARIYLRVDDFQNALSAAEEGATCFAEMGALDDALECFGIATQATTGLKDEAATEALKARAAALQIR